ncbi:Hypothetical predicted protein [Scomber scombrus]|uniref:Uncharacterized protein n=1 Tax=Scomber scombrus TaxID=13677 RepID=A0AAV1PP95_SCOSC
MFWKFTPSPQTNVNVTLLGTGSDERRRGSMKGLHYFIEVLQDTMLPYRRCHCPLASPFREVCGRPWLSIISGQLYTYLPGCAEPDTYSSCQMRLRASLAHRTKTENTDQPRQSRVEAARFLFSPRLL